LTARNGRTEARAELEERIVRKLGSFRSRDEIVKYVCEATGMRWNEAALYVKAIEEQQHPRLVWRRKSILLFLGMVTGLGGLAIAGAVAAATLNGMMFLFIDLPIPYLGNAVYFGFGVVVAGGGLAGCWRLLTQDE